MTILQTILLLALQYQGSSCDNQNICLGAYDVSRLQDTSSRYEGNIVLKKLARVLNRSCPQCKFHYDPNGFYVEEGRPVDFFVFDLTDTLNRSFPHDNYIEFRENHIYHFAPKYYEHSYSHLVILRKGKMKIFRSINCPGKGSDIEKVFKYLDKINILDAQIRRNVSLYRKFGRYVKMDYQTVLRCDRRYERQLKRTIRKMKAGKEP